MSTSSIVNTLGAGSGIDVKSLAQSLVDAEKAPKLQRIEEKIAKSEARITGYSAVKFALSELKNAFSKLNDVSDFSSIKTNNTQASAFNATASSTASAASYSIEILQTAQAQRSASNSFSARDMQINGGAAFSLNLTLGGIDQGSIQVTTSTPNGMVEAINRANLGISAQIIDTGNGFNLVVSGQTGEAQTFSLASDDGTGNTVADLNFDSTLQAASDASFKVNGLNITRTNNTVTDVIDGVTLELYAATNSAARLDLNRDTAGIKENIQGLVNAYNDFEETLKILSDRSSEVEEFGGVLAGESLLRSVRAQVRDLITNTSSTPGNNITAARDVGISIDRNGKLTLDESKLDTALQNNFGEVITMFSANTNNQSIYSTVSGGLAGDAVNSIDKMLRSTGLINTQSNSSAAQIAKFKEELTVLEERMEKLMTRYMAQFSAMESIVGNSNAMRDGLKNTFENMMNTYSK
jgi:flagellar hook-associated protein 2